MAQLRFRAMPRVIWLISGGMVYRHHLSNTIYSHKEQGHSANTLDCFSFKKQTFNKANIQNHSCPLLIQRKSIQSHNKGLKWCLRFTRAAQTLVSNRSKQSSETNTNQGGFRRTKRTQHTGPRAEQRLQSLPPHPVSSFISWRSSYEETFFKSGEEVCQRHGSPCLQRPLLIQSQLPPAFISCFMGLKLNET